ncbi:MAG: DUF1553 domain-containing protein [Isosphaeraceae bacterium]|nr:DUF1553 domain-containing protein [Isosphaeraceae bacterium]
MRTRRRPALLFLGLFIASTASAVAADPSADRFEKKIRPLLVDRCISCHGPEKQRGGLRLDSPEAIAEGGDNGSPVVAGKPDESLLVEVVRYASDLKMPPKGKLSDSDIAELVSWIREGAAWPASHSASATKTSTEKSDPSKPAKDRSIVTDEDRAFWAFRPPVDATPPPVRDTSWPRSPLDRFVLAGLESAGMPPAPETTRRDWLRRASFDLTGLPPTFEEVAAFEADTSAEAHAKVVDRLLDSPAYGERWGRHWLDLARYADSNGMDENVAYANAFRYRDYVVDAFNRDLPYDRFLREQIAGDLLPDSADPRGERARLTATGFLVIGPKMLAEDDPVKMEMDIIDEQVDTVGRVFMGLTLGCARCHDHKFDPIPTADYHALAGIFKSTKSMQNHKVVAMWNERPLDSTERGRLEAHRTAVAAKTAEVRKLTNKAQAELRKDWKTRRHAYMIAGWEARAWKPSKPPAERDAGLEGAIVREAESFDSGNVLVDTSHYGPGIGVILNKGELPNRAEYRIDVPGGGRRRLEIRYAAAEPRPVRLYINGRLHPEPIAATVTGGWEASAQKRVIAAELDLDAGINTLRLECDGPFPHFDRLALLPPTSAEVLSPAAIAARDGLNERLVARVAQFWAAETADSASPLRDWFRAVEGEARQALGRLLEEKLQEAEKPAKEGSDPVVARLRSRLQDPKGLLELPKPNAQAPLFSPASAKLVDAAKAELAALEASTPPVEEAMSVEDQAVVDLRIHIRGSHLTLGDVAPRGFPRVLLASSPAPLPRDRSGRLELADWLASPEHPLTARVMVNRIWAGHFGQGLVRSLDNFGRLGETPTHPELLDWLAHRFVESGWSIKAMHRLIMLSSTYRMSSRHDPNAAEADPENRRLRRFDRRRLEAEAVRDAILAVSGRLDPTRGGSLLPTKNHAYVNNTGQRGSIRYDVPRRSIYLPVIRSGVYEVFQAFDFADPSTSNGMRIPTTVAPQALFMLNDAIVLDAAKDLGDAAARLAPADDGERVRMLYRRILARDPSEPEVDRALGHLSRFHEVLLREGVDPEQRPLQAWSTIAQALLASSEFLYLD